MNENPSNVPAPGGDAGDLASRMAKLLDEVQAVKMLSLQRSLQSSGAEESGADGEGLKHGQMVLKAVEIQLRILGEQIKRLGGAGLPLELEVIWEAVSGASLLRPVIGRAPVLAEVIARLKEFAASCAPAGAAGPEPDDKGGAGDDAAIQ